MVYLVVDLTASSAACHLVLIPISASKESGIEKNAPAVPRELDRLKVTQAKFPDDGAFTSKEYVGDFNQMIAALDLFFSFFFFSSHSDIQVSGIHVQDKRAAASHSTAPPTTTFHGEYDRRDRDVAENEILMFMAEEERVRGQFGGS